MPEAVVLCASEAFDRDMASRVAMGTGTLEVAAYDDEIEGPGGDSGVGGCSWPLNLR